MRHLFTTLIAILGLTLVCAAADKANLLKDAGKNLRLEQHEGGKATNKMDGETYVFEVTTTGSESWHVQATFSGLNLQEGKEYVLTFKAKGEPARAISVQAMIDVEDWHTIGLTEEVSVEKEFKPFSFTFKADGVAKENKNRISFLMGSEKGVVSIKDLSLTEK